MPATGYIQVRAYTSYAQIPVQNVAVSITATDGTAIAMRTTDRNGQIRPIPIPVPDRSAGLTPNTGIRPYAVVSLYAKKENFEEIYIEDLQVFANTITLQPLQLIPNAELPAAWNKGETFVTTPQNL